MSSLNITDVVLRHGQYRIGQSAVINGSAESSRKHYGKMMQEHGGGVVLPYELSYKLEELNALWKVQGLLSFVPPDTDSWTSQGISFAEGKYFLCVGYDPHLKTGDSYRSMTKFVEIDPKELFGQTGKFIQGWDAKASYGQDAGQKFLTYQGGIRPVFLAMPTTGEKDLHLGSVDWNTISPDKLRQPGFLAITLNGNTFYFKDTESPNYLYLTKSRGKPTHLNGSETIDDILGQIPSPTSLPETHHPSRLYQMLSKAANNSKAALSKTGKFLVEQIDDKTYLPIIVAAAGYWFGFKELFNIPVTHGQDFDPQIFFPISKGIAGIVIGTWMGPTQLRFITDKTKKAIKYLSEHELDLDLFAKTYKNFHDRHILKAASRYTGNNEKYKELKKRSKKLHPYKFRNIPHDAITFFLPPKMDYEKLAGPNTSSAAKGTGSNPKGSS